LYPERQEENMNKGFTLIETLAALSLLLFAVLSSSRIMVAALAWTRQAGTRFRLVETLDYYKNYLSSLPLAAPELAAGDHGRNEGSLRVAWRVEAAGAFLKRVRLAVATARLTLQVVLYRSQFIQAVRP
jgi:prepilin-type N-terminal cleavage/methylation domain-containing protein